MSNVEKSWRVVCYTILSIERTNSKIIDDLNEGDSMYATTGGDEINYIEA